MKLAYGTLFVLALFRYRQGLCSFIVDSPRERSNQTLITKLRVLVAGMIQK